jgi:hypothetical protein
MMTDEQKAKVAELKAQIAASATRPDGVPPEARAAALTLKKELRRDGTTARVLAAALGVHETTLCRWQRDDRVRRGPASTDKPATTTKKRRRRDAGFRMVQVAASTPPAAATAPPRGLRVAHAPSGLVVDGLDVETLAALLRSMS